MSMKSLVGLVMLLVVCFSVSEAVAATLKENSVACISEESYEMYLSMAASDPIDKAGLDLLQATRACFISKSVAVDIEDSWMFKGYAKVRVRGSLLFVWVSMESLIL